MKKIPLYKYTREDGGITVSPNKPDVEYTEMSRLVADKDKVLTDGNVSVPMIDTDSPDNWQEVDRN